MQILKNSLLIVIITVFLMSCATTKVVYRDRIVYKVPPQIYLPEEPKYKKLKSDELICSPYNTQAILYNLNSMRLYINKLKTIIKLNNTIIDSIKKRYNIKDDN